MQFLIQKKCTQLFGCTLRVWRVRTCNRRQQNSAMMKRMHFFGSDSTYLLYTKDLHFILQYREKLPGAPDVTHQVVLITPENTCVLECTEASQTFSDKPLEGSSIYTDLYSMTLDVAKPEVLEQMTKAKAVFVNSVYEFLTCTKVLSYA